MQPPMNNSHSQFFAAITAGHSRAVERILQTGVSPNIIDADGQPALIRACEQSETGNARMLELLLSYGADNNIRGKDGGTPLMWASEYSEDIAEKLLTRDPAADPHLCMTGNVNALHIASQFGHERIVKMLLERHVNPNLDSKDLTPLCLAASEGHTEIVKFLIKGGAEIDMPSKIRYGTTALMAAAIMGHTECVKVLLVLGANPKLHNDNGWTALMSAKERNHTEIIAYWNLIKKMAGLLWEN